MIGFVLGPLFFALIMMGFFADFTMLEPQQSGQSISIFALPTLKAIQAASETACNAGCPDGPIDITTPIPETVTGVFGTGSISGVVVSWFVANPPSAGKGLLRKTTYLDAATKSVIGIYNAETRVATGVQQESLLGPASVLAPPMTFTVSGGLTIPDQAVILTERRLP